MPKTSAANSKPSSNSASKRQGTSKTTSTHYQQIFVGRNLRRIQKKAGVPRCAKDVGAAILRHDVVPSLELLIQQELFLTQRNKRRTVKETHCISAFNQLFSKGPVVQMPKKAGALVPL